MRRPRVVSALAALAAGSMLAGLVITDTSAASRVRPLLTVHGSAPVVVAGAHFRAGERVRLTLLPGPSVNVRANSRGAFSVSVPGAPVDRCNSLIVHARGSAGSFASARRPPLPQCLPVRVPVGAT